MELPKKMKNKCLSFLFVMVFIFCVLMINASDHDEEKPKSKPDDLTHTEKTIEIWKRPICK